jgi:hypothetical protein
MANEAASVEKTGPDSRVLFWLDEIDAAQKREKDFRKEGTRILKIYEGDPKSEDDTRTLTPYNILYSNTETLIPALYSSVPRPVVQRRFKDADPLGKAAAHAGQRVLEFLVDTNNEGYETFDEGMHAATLDAALPGRGVTTVKYDADFGEMAPKDGETEPTPYTKSELVCLDTRKWNRVLFGYSTKWSKVPWVAYEEHVDKVEATKQFGKAVADKLVYTKEETNDKDQENKRSDDEKHQGERKTVCIYQIWDKDATPNEPRKVRYVCQQYKDNFLKVEDDPLGLTGFFNCPRPLMFVEKNGLTPTALYQLYENQAGELNRLTIRINHIVRAIKARGIYDSSLGADLTNLMKEEDNALVPSENPAGIASDGKSIKDSIWFMPLDVLITVLTQLIAARQQCKQVIYEITGLSDIIRGASVASETATAQNIKNQWGTLRIKRLQKEVQRYSRDLLRMMLEIAATKFSEDTWAKMTGLPYLTQQKVQELTAVAQAGDQQAAQALQSTPTWEQVLTLLRDDMQRAYRIDIETNSTIEPEAAEDQKQITELMSALGQYLNGVGPLVQKGVMPFGVAQNMLLAITRRFRFGSEIEDDIKQMQPPKPEDDGQAQAAQKAQMDAQQQQVQSQATISQLQTQLKQSEAERQISEKEATLKLRELAVKTEEELLAMRKEVENEKLAMKSATFDTKRSADDKVRSIKDQGVKREQQVAEKADNKLAEGVGALQATVEKMAEMQTQLVATVVQQSEAQAERIEKVVQAVTAPRVKKAVRGKDGRIEAVEEMAG